MSVLAVLIGVAQAEVNISVADMSIDGLAVRALECSLDQGGFLAAATVVGALAQHEAALDACAPEGAAFAVKWVWGSRAEAVVLASSKDAASECIQAALMSTSSTLNGQCTAVVLVGDEAAAAAAAAPLLQPTTP